MRPGRWIVLLVGAAAIAGLALPLAFGAPAHKTHVVALSAAKKVPYSKLGDPAGAATGEDMLRIRALVVDGLIKEWTTGDAHDVTDRSFVVRRVMKINDRLPGEGSGAGEGPPQMGSATNPAQSPTRRGDPTRRAGRSRRPGPRRRLAIGFGSGGPGFWSTGFQDISPR